MFHLWQQRISQRYFHNVTQFNTFESSDRSLQLTESYSSGTWEIQCFISAKFKRFLFSSTEAPRKDNLLKTAFANYRNGSLHLKRLQVIIFVLFYLNQLCLFPATFPCQQPGGIHVCLSSCLGELGICIWERHRRFCL